MAKKSNFQINLEYFVARLIFTLVGILPRSAAILFGVIIGKIGFLALKKLRGIGLTNVAIAFPDMPEAERRDLVRGCFISLGRQLGEISQFRKATEDSLGQLVEFNFTAREWDLYEKAKEDGRGVIFLTPHFGGWEILAFASSALIGPQSYLVRPLDNPRLEKLVEDIRGKFGNRPIGKTNSLATVLQLLRGGGNLGVLPDLNAQRHEGVFVPFFGHQACTTAGVAALAMRTRAVSVVVGASWDKKKKKYVVHFGEHFEFESTGNRQKDVLNFTAHFTKDIEDLIRRSPEQWLWIHRRWNTRPDGEVSFYN